MPRTYRAQSMTAQSRMVQSMTAQSRTVQSMTAQSRTVQSMTAQSLRPHSRRVLKKAENVIHADGIVATNAPSHKQLSDFTLNANV